MDDIQNFFPEFVPNQVLTDTQLNQLRIYLDQQERLARIRLVGMGIICGLNWKLVAGPQITVSAGFGITSDGYLIELPQETTYTHFRAYKDPDVEEDKQTPRYKPWQKFEILELLDTNRMSSSKQPVGAKLLKADTAKEPVLVLYLEREPVDLNTCLATGCDNKGQKINFSVRALLVPKNAVDEIKEGTQPLDLARLPRLHTKVTLGNVTSAAALNNAYGRICKQEIEPLLDKIKVAFKLYGDFPNIHVKDPNWAQALNTKVLRLVDSQQINQYHYDLLKDLACAYNEAATAACELMMTCCPVRIFPRHLMLGTMKNGELDQAYRHPFMPSPVRNVMHGDFERVQKLFQRMIAMAENFEFKLGEEIRLTPSHTELHPLGARALPFYYRFDDLKDLWQPRLCCTSEGLWSYHVPDAERGLNYLYPYASFMRIEGHLHKDYKDVRGEIEALRGGANAEFDLVKTYLQDPDPDETAYDKAIAQIEDEHGEVARKLTDAIQQTLSNKDLLSNNKNVIGLGGRIYKVEQKLIETRRAWGETRCARELHCDVGALEADYTELRASLLCTFHELLGQLAKLSEVSRAPGTYLDEDAKARASLLWPHIRAVAAERITAAVVAMSRTTSVPKDLQEPLEAIDQRWAASIEKHELAPSVVLWAAVEAARYNIQVFVDAYFPRRLCEFEYRLMVVRHKEIVGDLMRVLLLCELIEFLVTGKGSGEETAQPTLGVTVVPGLAVGPMAAMIDIGKRVGQPPVVKGLEWRHAIASLLQTISSCLRARLAAVAIQYEDVRNKDLSLFKNLAAAVDGMEHTAGVEKGGTFILACERDTKSGEYSVVADFSLAGRLRCCCDYDPTKLCLPLVALPDYRVAILRRDEKGTYEPVTLQIDVLANDYDPNSETIKGRVERSASLVFDYLLERTDLRGTVKQSTSYGVVEYSLESPQPGQIDRFAYKIKRSDEKYPSDSAEVLILLLPEPETELQPPEVKLGKISVHVIDRSKAVVSRVSVTLLSGQAEVPKGTTNATGVVEFARVAPGTYTATAEKPGYWSGTIDVELSSGEDASVTITLGAMNYFIPREFIERVIGEKEISRADAEDLTRKVYADRFAHRYKVLTDVGADPKVKASPEYRATEVFFKDVLAVPDVTDDRVAKAYVEVASGLTKSINGADTEQQRDAFQGLLTTATLGLLDRLTLTNPEKLSAEAPRVLTQAAKALEAAKIERTAVLKQWDGASLSRDLTVTSAGAINELLRT